MRVAVLLISVAVLLVAVCADESSTYSDTVEPTTTGSDDGKGNSDDPPFPYWAIILVALGIIIPFLIVVIVAVVWRRRLLPCCKGGDEEAPTPAKNPNAFLSRTPFSKTPETRIYLDPEHFEHKGPLAVKNETQLELKPQINKEDEKVVASPHAHFRFAEEPGAHVVYDIGSDVEQIQ